MWLDDHTLIDSFLVLEMLGEAGYTDSCNTSFLPLYVASLRSLSCNNTKNLRVDAHGPNKKSKTNYKEN